MSRRHWHQLCHLVTRILFFTVQIVHRQPKLLISQHETNTNMTRAYERCYVTKTPFTRDCVETQRFRFKCKVPRIKLTYLVVVLCPRLRPFWSVFELLCNTSPLMSKSHVLVLRLGCLCVIEQETRSQGFNIPSWLKRPLSCDNKKQDPAFFAIISQLPGILLLLTPFDLL